METVERSEKLPAAPEWAAEAKLIDETSWGAVRALIARGLSKKAIARELDLDIKTVRKWCRQSWSPQRRRSRGRMLTSWEEFLRGRAPEVGFNAAVPRRGRGARCFASRLRVFGEFAECGLDQQRWNYLELNNGGKVPILTSRRSRRSS